MTDRWRETFNHKDKGSPPGYGFSWTAGFTQMWDSSAHSHTLITGQIVVSVKLSWHIMLLGLKHSPVFTCQFGIASRCEGHEIFEAEFWNSRFARLSEERSILWTARSKSYQETVMKWQSKNNLKNTHEWGTGEATLASLTLHKETASGGSLIKDGDTKIYGGSMWEFTKNKQ